MKMETIEYGLKKKNTLDRMIYCNVSKNDTRSLCNEYTYRLTDIPMKNDKLWKTDDVDIAKTIASLDDSEVTPWYNSKEEEPTINSNLIGELEVVKITTIYETIS